MTDVVMVQTTVADAAAADALARSVVGAGLAACVHILPVKSVYRWEGRVEGGGEMLMVFKTAASRAAELMRFVKEAHAYEVPELLLVPVADGAPDYLEWVLETGGTG